MTPFQLIIGHSETNAWEQITAIPVVFKGAGFSYEPVDYVPVLDTVLSGTSQPGHGFDELLPVPYIQIVLHTASL